LAPKKRFFPEQAETEGAPGGPSGLFWVVYHYRNKYRIAAPRERYDGRFVLQASSREDAERLALDCAVNDEPHPARDQQRYNVKPHARGVRPIFPGKFRCRHPRTPENTYMTKTGPNCRQCSRARVTRYRERHPERVRQIRRSVAHRFRHRNRLAYLLYDQLRGLAIQDGLWPAPVRRGRNAEPEKAA